MLNVGEPSAGRAKIGGLVAKLVLGAAAATVLGCSKTGDPARADAHAAARSGSAPATAGAKPAAVANQPAGGHAGQVQDVEAVVRQLRRVQAMPFVQPSADQARLYRQSIGRALHGAEPGAVPGFAWRSDTLAERGVSLLAEDGINQGAGVVVVRHAPRAQLVVEAPHTFFDQGTLQLAQRVFDTLGAAVLIVNTQHRAQGVDDDDRHERARAGEEVTDLAHNRLAYFQAAHEACLEALPAAVVLQLHGFRDDKVPHTQAVVSAAGTTGPATAVVAALNAAFGPGMARAFPDEVQALGAMSNVQAKASREAGRPFVHIELSGTFRKKLANDEAEEARFVRAVAAGLGLPAAATPASAESAASDSAPAAK